MDLALTSAVVILARERADRTPELFMVRRSARANAFADVFVFPGGVVRDDDHADGEVRGADGIGPDEALAALSERGGTPPPDGETALALYRAAVRELFEEAGVLLARTASGALASIGEPEAERFDRWRRILQADETSLDELLTAERVTPALRELRYFSHWITPLGLPRRFDTRFFVATLPPGQTALHCRVETSDGVWISAGTALAEHAVGRFPLVLPTRMHLERISALPTLAALIEMAETKRIVTVLGTGFKGGTWSSPEDGCW